MALEQYSFGSGSVWFTPLNVTVPQPIQIGTLQEASVDFSWSEKMLQGQYDAPSAIARGALKITGKIKNAKIRVQDIATSIFGASAATGITETAINEGLPNGTAIPASAPYTITVVNAATFVQDLGVVNVTTGAQLTAVASAPATGQYSVSAAGVYTFAAADTGTLVAISYQWTSATNGKSFTYYQQLMGPRPTFKLILSNVGFMNNPAYAGQPIGMTLWNTGISKFSLDWKNEDWMVPESDISCASDFLGRVFTMGADK